MIRGIHGLLYSSNPAASRAFFRDRVNLSGCDIGDGWWIFDFPEGDLGVHPVYGAEGKAGVHDVSFYCDDIHGTVADLKSRGVKFTGPVEDHGYGFVTHFKVPGGIVVQLYQPKYKKKKTAGRKAANRAKKPATAAATSRARGASRGPRKNNLGYSSARSRL